MEHYYYLAVNREGVVKRLTSPTEKDIKHLIRWGYKCDGYDSLEDMPVNPKLFIDHENHIYEIREKTEADIITETIQKKLTRKSFNFREIMNVCDTIDETNGNTVLNDKLDVILENKKFARHLWSAGELKLDDAKTVEAMNPVVGETTQPVFTNEELYAILTGL